MMVVVYLVAGVVANIAITLFGVKAAIPVSFILVGFDLTSRDKLHEKWRGEKLWFKMALLIGMGSLLSYLLNASSLKIAIASFAAFALSGIADSLVYHALGDAESIRKSNYSNVASSFVDSIVFPTIAFGQFMPFIIAGQFAAKVLGGIIWSSILFRKK